MATGTQLGWQLWLLFLIFSNSLMSIHGSKLERRELPSLSSTDITKLVTATDPLINLDPSNPASHLSKILIPRAGMPLLSLGHGFI
jgi:glutaminyl-peptide cyclotransferase